MKPPKLPAITLCDGEDLTTRVAFQKAQDGGLLLVAREGENSIEVWLDLDDVIQTLKNLKRRKA